MGKDGRFDSGRPFDWSRTSETYAKYRDGYPAELYDALEKYGIGHAGQSVLDLGTGTGALARGMYPRGARWTGADISASQIEQARILSARKDMDIEYIVASAEDAPFPAGSFDAVTACQCFWYFDERRALENIHRILRPDGLLCIIYMFWLPGQSEAAAGTERIILKYNPVWTGGGYRKTPPSVPEGAAGLFECTALDTFEADVEFTPESWHGRMKACRGTGASMDPDSLALWEKEHLEYAAALPERFSVPHYITLILLRAV